MELQNRRIKSACSSPLRRQILPKTTVSIKPLKFFSNKTSASNSKVNTTRRPYSEIKRRKKRSDELKQEVEFYKKINASVNPLKIEEIYHSKRLSLTQNSFIFQEDAYKLQNLITGGYCCDQDFMSLSKFNQTKDNFVLLKQIYDKAKTDKRVKKLQKQNIQSRNIFSVIFLNQNLRKMNKKETNTIFHGLKIVR